MAPAVQQQIRERDLWESVMTEIKAAGGIYTSRRGHHAINPFSTLARPLSHRHYLPCHILWGVGEGGGGGADLYNSRCGHHAINHTQLPGHCLIDIYCKPTLSHRVGCVCVGGGGVCITVAEDNTLLILILHTCQAIVSYTLLYTYPVTSCGVCGGGGGGWGIYNSRR